jgi:hypothetical protein
MWVAVCLNLNIEDSRTNYIVVLYFKTVPQIGTDETSSVWGAFRRVGLCTGTNISEYISAYLFRVVYVYLSWMNLKTEAESSSETLLSI